MPEGTGADWAAASYPLMAASRVLAMALREDTAVLIAEISMPVAFMQVGK
jgi:hypothetical protein